MTQRLDINYLHSWNPPLIMEGGGFFKIFEKKGGGQVSSDFSHKKGGVGKIGGLF